jgi:hypothetical protein
VCETLFVADPFQELAFERFDFSLWQFSEWQ